MPLQLPSSEAIVAFAYTFNRKINLVILIMLIALDSMFLYFDVCPERWQHIANISGLISLLFNQTIAAPRSKPTEQETTLRL